MEDRTGIALRACRKRRSLTLADVSRDTGVPVATLHRWETGGATCPAGRLVAVLAALGVTGREYEAELCPRDGGAS